MSPAVADDTGLLKRIGNDRDRVALYTDHLRQAFLGQRQAFTLGQIARAQQPARQARFDRMRRVTGGGLLGLCDKALFMSCEQGSKGSASLGHRPKSRGVEGCSG